MTRTRRSGGPAGHPPRAIRPRLRRRESLPARARRGRARRRQRLAVGDGRTAGGPAVFDRRPGTLAIYLAVLVGVHLAQVLAGRRTDQVLLPTVGMLGGICLLLMERLPQDLVNQTFVGTTLRARPGPARVAAHRPRRSSTTLAIVVRSDSWLRLYKYTWAAAGVGLLLLTFVLGVDVNGAAADAPARAVQRPAVRAAQGDPGRLPGRLPVRESRAPRSSRTPGSGRLRLPPVPYLAPMVAMWAIALADRRRPARSRRGTPVLPRLPRSCCTSRRVGSSTRRHRGHPVRRRQRAAVPTGRPRPDPGRHLARPVRGPDSAPATRSIQALHAFARGGIARDGARGGPAARSAAGCRSRRSTPTSRSRPSARSSAWPGILAILGLYLVVVERGLRIAAAAADDFRALLAAGLSLVVGVQAFIIAAGNLKLIPLTGHHAAVHQLRRVVARWPTRVVVGLLLALSDRASSRHHRRARPAPRRAGRAGDRPIGAPGCRAWRAGLVTGQAGRRTNRRPIAGNVARSALPSSSRSGSSPPGRRLLAARPVAGPVDLAGRPGRHRGGPGRAPRADHGPPRHGPRLATEGRQRRAVPRLSPDESISPVVGYASTRLRDGRPRAGLRRRADRTGRSDPAGRGVAQVRQPIAVRPPGPHAVDLAATSRRPPWPASARTAARS